MSKNTDTTIKIHLNLFDIKINFDAIYHDFDIWTIKEKGEKYASYSDICSLVGFNKILSVFKPFGGRIWLLTKKDEFINTKDIIDNNSYDVDKIPQEDFNKYPQSKVNLINLFVNSLPKYIEKSGYKKRFGDNVAGGLYILNSRTLSKLSKNLPDIIQAYHINFANDNLNDIYNKFVLNIVEKTAFKQSYLKTIFNSNAYNNSPKVSLDKNARALKIPKKDDKDLYVFYGSREINIYKSKRTEHLNIGVGDSKYSKSRSSLYEDVYSYIKEHFARYIPITQENREAYRKDVAGRKTSKKYLDDIRKKSIKFYFVNKSDKNINGINLPYSDLFEFVDEEQPESLNLICVDNKEYYKKNNKEDPYTNFNYNSKVVKQHIYYENLLGKQEEIIIRLSACVREMLCKNDMKNRIITTFDYKKLGLTEPLEIIKVVKGKSNKSKDENKDTVKDTIGIKDIIEKNESLKAYSLIFNPTDGKLTFKEGCSLNLESFYKEDCRYIFKYKDNVNYLKESNVSSLNCLDSYSESIVQKYEQNEYSNGDLVQKLLNIVLGFDDINEFYTKFFEYIHKNLVIPPQTSEYNINNNANANANANDFYYQLASNFLNVDCDLESISKKNFERRLLNGLYSKSRDKHREIKNKLKEEGIFLTDKSKNNIQELMPEGFDIHYFQYTNKFCKKVLAYKVSQSASGIQDFLKITNKSKIWLLEGESEKSSIMEFLLDTLDVDFIGSGKPLVLPFFCKYLNEYVAGLEN